MRIRSLVVITLALIPMLSFAQDEDYNAIAQQYSNENAVITNNSQHLVINYKDGKLQAESYVAEERLMISAVSPSIYNTQNVYHSYFNPLEDLQAETLIPGKRKYQSIKTTDFKTTQSQSDDIFYDDSKKTTITFSGVIQGAITRINYTIKHKDIHFLPIFYFQDFSPIVKNRFEITVPKFVKLRYVMIGDNADRVTMTTHKHGNNITYEWTTKDMPAIKSPDAAPPVAFYALHIIPFIDSYTSPDDGQKVSVLSSPADLYHYYYPFIKDVNKKDDPQFDTLVKSITKGDATQYQKAKHIYEWVQNNLHYVAFEDKFNGFVPREAANICNNKFGDCKDMASVLVAMCRKAGLDAYFTWVGTRDKPYTYEQTPLPIVDNHMICTIKLDGKWVFMDGTDPLIPFGIPPYAIQGKEALIGIDATNFKIVKVPVQPALNNFTSDSTFIHLSGNNAVGSTDIHYTGYPAWDIGTVMMFRNKDEKEKAIQSITSRGSDKFFQSKYNYNAAKDKGKEVSLTSDFEIKDYAQNINKEYYINLNLLRSFSDDNVDADRIAPLTFDYKDHIKQVVVLDIPKGYHVSYLPPNDKKSVDGLFSYDITYKKTAKQVQLIKDFVFDKLYIQPSQFASFNKLINDLKKQYRESVVLTAN